MAIMRMRWLESVKWIIFERTISVCLKNRCTGGIEKDTIVIVPNINGNVYSPGRSKKFMTLILISVKPDIGIINAAPKYALPWK